MKERKRETVLYCIWTNKNVGWGHAPAGILLIGYSGIKYGKFLIQVGAGITAPYKEAQKENHYAICI